MRFRFVHLLLHTIFMFFVSSVSPVLLGKKKPYRSTTHDKTAIFLQASLGITQYFATVCCRRNRRILGSCLRPRYPKFTHQQQLKKKIHRFASNRLGQRDRACIQHPNPND